MLLETKDLTKIYRRGEKEFRAVDKASISVEKGELAVITGPSGCGKSTLFHLISGITVPDSGLVLFEGDEITGISPQAAARLRAEKISYILQGNSLLANLTVLENICLPPPPFWMRNRCGGTGHKASGRVWSGGHGRGISGKSVRRRKTAGGHCPCLCP